MKPSEVGAVLDPISSPEWHRELTDAQLAAYIRYQYIKRYENEWDWDSPAHNRPRIHWDGGKDSFGVRHSPVWGRIATMVRQHRADPGIWVAAHFSGVSYLKLVTEKHSIPDMRPNRLCTAKSAAIYHEYLSEAAHIIRSACQVAGGTIANRIRGTQALGLSLDDQLYYVLGDEGYVSASPFFRHAFAARMGCDRALERYLWLAALDYEAQQRAYDVALQNEPWCITEPLIAATIEIRNHWKGYV